MFMDSGLAASRRPGMTTEVTIRILYHFRFTRNSGHCADIRERPRSAKSGRPRVGWK
jgi:hypothetical protein